MSIINKDTAKEIKIYDMKDSDYRLSLTDTKQFLRFPAAGDCEFNICQS